MFVLSVGLCSVPSAVKALHGPVVSLKVSYRGLKIARTGGNLCAHANKSHGGQTVYLDVCNGEMIYYYRRRWFAFFGLYSNIYGLLPKDYKNEDMDMSLVELN